VVETDQTKVRLFQLLSQAMDPKKKDVLMVRCPTCGGRGDILMDASKRHWVDAEKRQKAVAKEFAAKRAKKGINAKFREAAN
jgi:hypothetical protein